MNTKSEFAIVNGDNIIGIAYKHETLGRIVVLSSLLDVSQTLDIHALGDNDGAKCDILEFIMETIPREDKNEN